MSRMTARPMPATAGLPACAADPELMFPPRDSLQPGMANKQERRALEVCAGCPVLATCRAAVLGSAPMPFGVAGGLTMADRRAVRAEQSLAHLEQATRSEGAEGSDALVPAPRVAPDGQPASAARPITADASCVVRAGRPPSASAPSVTPAALAVLNRGGHSESRRPPARKNRTGRAPDPTLASAPTPASAPAAVELGDELDELIAGLLRTYPASLADPATVRELVLERGSAAASRWEVAIAAMTMLARGVAAQAAARLLGEDGKQIRRWRHRREGGRPLVPGGADTGTHRLARPARFVTTSAPVAAASTQRGAA